jgi:hypothetical protein
LTTAAPEGFKASSVCSIGLRRFMVKPIGDGTLACKATASGVTLPSSPREIFHLNQAFGVVGECCFFVQKFRKNFQKCDLHHTNSLSNG